MYFIKKFLLAFLFIGFFSFGFAQTIVGLPDGSYSTQTVSVEGVELPVVKVVVTPGKEFVATTKEIYGEIEPGHADEEFWLYLNNNSLKGMAGKSLSITFDRAFLDNSTISLNGSELNLTLEAKEITVTGNSFIKTIAPDGKEGQDANGCYYSQDDQEWHQKSDGRKSTAGKNGKSAGSIELNAKVVFSENSSLEILSQGGKGGNGGKNCDGSRKPSGSGGNAGEIFIKSVDSTALNSSLSLKSIGGKGGSGETKGKVSIGKDSENDLVGSLEGFTPVLVEAGELFINSDDSAVIDSVIDLSSHAPASVTFNFCKAKYKNLEIKAATVFEFSVVDVSYFWYLFNGKIEADDPKNAVHLFEGTEPPTEPVYTPSKTAIIPHKSGKCASEAPVLKPVIFSFFASVVEPDLTGASGTIDPLVLEDNERTEELDLFSFLNPLLGPSSDFNGFVSLSFGDTPSQGSLYLLELWLGNLYWFGFGLGIETQGETKQATGELPLQLTPPQQAGD